MGQDIQFNKLFVFEMANNHMGSVEHGLRVINELHEVAKNFNFNYAVKFQFRELDTFIHPDYKERLDLKYIKRFSETRLSQEQFLTLLNETKKCGFYTMATPFDELSVDLIEQFNIDIIKIASCACTDWPLLEKIATMDKPVIASTAGVSYEEIDKVVKFFTHRQQQFALMQCVGSYPTPHDMLELNQIDIFKTRYPDVTIGYSTHEDPSDYDGIKIAVAKGAEIFEKHVGVKTEEYGINGYSATPDQILEWLKAAKKTYEICGAVDSPRVFSEKEVTDLRGLKRGVFAKTPLTAGTKLDMSNTYFAIPNIEGQVLANDFSKYTDYILKKDVGENQPVMFDDTTHQDNREEILDIVKDIRALLIDSKIHLPNKMDFEISHHYGISEFRNWGATIINCINREYCKKLVILLPGQKHPIHKHVKKEETFHVLYGEVDISINGEEKTYNAGDMILIKRGAKHSFSSESGGIFEEISTPHYKDDSYYDDKKILENQNRKTYMTYWSDWLKEEIK